VTANVKNDVKNTTAIIDAEGLAQHQVEVVDGWSPLEDLRHGGLDFHLDDLGEGTPGQTFPSVGVRPLASRRGIKAIDFIIYPSLGAQERRPRVAGSRQLGRARRSPRSPRARRAVAKTSALASADPPPPSPARRPNSSFRAGQAR
jgi:hypothetical protein